MTIKIILKCDSGYCCNSVEIPDYTDDEIERAGWHVDHKRARHYCPKCWPKVEKELYEDE